MKKLLEKIEFLIYLCQQIHGLLKAAPDTLKSLAAPQIEFLSVQQVANKFYVQPRQVWHYIEDKKIEPFGWFGRSPYFALDYINDVIASGKLRQRRKR